MISTRAANSLITILALAFLVTIIAWSGGAFNDPADSGGIHSPKAEVALSGEWCVESDPNEQGSVELCAKMLRGSIEYVMQYRMEPPHRQRRLDFLYVGVDGIPAGTLYVDESPVYLDTVRFRDPDSVRGLLSRAEIFRVYDPHLRVTFEFRLKDVEGSE
jgi:hypothetical protein